MSSCHCYRTDEGILKKYDYIVLRSLMGSKRFWSFLDQHLNTFYVMPGVNLRAVVKTHVDTSLSSSVPRYLHGLKKAAVSSSVS